MKTHVITLSFLLVLSVDVCPQGVRADRHGQFPSIVGTIRALVKFKGRSKKQNTIYVSNISSEEGREFSYAYWKEDNSITILNLPLSVPLLKNTGDYYWLTMKARIDLKTDVVPTQEDIHGSSFLVDRPWVEKIKRRCLSGIRLRF